MLLTMWSLLVLLFVATAGASDYYESEDPMCMDQVYSECDKSVDAPEDLPGTEEELEEACKFALGYIDCADRIVETCDQTGPRIEDFKSLSPFVRSVCDKDSPLFSVVAESLGCFKKNREQISSCHRGDAEIDVKSFSETLNSIGITDVVNSNNSICLGTLYRVSCTAANTGKICGDAARDLLLNLSQRFVSRYSSCPENIQEKLPEIVKVLQLEGEIAEDVENAIKKKK